MAVIQRSAGLKPLTRRFAPMQPKVHPYLRKQNAPVEPLYRRAQLASHLKEIVKVPNVLPMSSSMPAALYYLDDSDVETTKTNGSQTKSQQTPGIRLPAAGPLSSIRSTVSSTGSEDNKGIKKIVK